MSAQAYDLRIDDRRPPAEDILDVVRRGLLGSPKRLPSWLFYDERGSALFERICEQPEYYLTRAECALMERHGESIAAALGTDVRLVEYGSGSARKTDILLQQLASPVAYVPVEISPGPLMASVQRLAARYPQVPMQPLCADFTRPLRLPIPARAARRTVLYFPGSTIGNFESREAVKLLRKMRNEMGENGGVLVGVDLKKDVARLEAAYNDAAGVTAEFTLNMLVRLNGELGCDFDLRRFRHRAQYNAMAGRIETSIVSLAAQTVNLGRDTVTFQADEAMQVEYSCKYSLADFAALAAQAGLDVQRVWTDPDGLFSLQYLTRSAPGAR
jgi:dimethylhistidine N-methyltransferase